MRKIRVTLLCVIFSVAYAGITVAEQPLTPEQLEEWFYDDERLHPYETTPNEASLRFLATPPTKRTPYSRNILTITEHSLTHGWVHIEQCHEQLDPIHAVEVVYRYKQLRGLRITKATGIGKAWVEGQSVQLQDVQTGAELCIQLEAKILYKQKGGGLVLRNGPFQRKFLDGYFPLHVRLQINFPGHRLRFIDSQPRATPGFAIEKDSHSVTIDTWFEGQLFIEVNFGLVT